MTTYCQEHRYGMHSTKDSTCGELATHTANGRPVCEVHARRSFNEGKIVEPIRPESET